MADVKKDWTPTIIAAVIGVAFIGFQQQQKNNADNVGNLPATNANVSSNAEAILRNSQNSAAALNAAVGLVRAEINRRETETIKYVDTLDTKKTSRVDGIEGRIARLEDLLVDHVNTPSARHTHGP